MYGRTKYNSRPTYVKFGDIEIEGVGFGKMRFCKIEFSEIEFSEMGIGEMGIDGWDSARSESTMQWRRL